MPTYSYRCTACEHAFDIQQAFTDDALSECPECRGTLRKVFTAIGVSFQGSGFYRTDSRAEAASSASKAQKKSAGSSESGKSDSAASDSGKSGAGKSESGKTESTTTPAKPAAAQSTAAPSKSTTKDKAS